MPDQPKMYPVAPPPSLTTLATSLSKKIEAFEDFVNTLDGHLEFVYEVPDDRYEEGDIRTIRLQRHSKRWVVEVSYETGIGYDDPPEESFVPLRSSDVETKAYAVRHLAEFWKETLKRREKVIAKLKESNDAIDRFFAEVQIPLTPVPTTVRKEGK